MSSGWQAGYVYLMPEGTQITRTIDAGGGVMIDLDSQGRPAGIETLGSADWQSALASLAMAGRIRIT